MGPKKGGDEAKGWRQELERAVLNDNDWTVKAIMFEPAGGDQDRMYLTKFESFAALEKRFVIKSINKSETMFMINQLGGERKVKESSHHHPVFEEAGTFIKEKKDVPPYIMALVIKHLMLKMRADYLFVRRQRLQVKEGIKRESEVMLSKSEVKNTVIPISEPSGSLPPSPTKGKGKEKVDDVNAPITLEEGKKYNTPLRVRGEEWRDRIYVDDFPLDGPNTYVAISGFLDPLLAGCLINIGIPLAAIVQIRINPALDDIPSSLTKVSKRENRASQTEMETHRFLMFWDGLQQLRIAKDTADRFTDTAFIIFSPPYWDTDKLTGNPDIVYDEISYLMYDVQDLTRQHKHYLENMDVHHVPGEEDPVDEDFVTFYNEYVDIFPVESISIFSIMHGILQTVCVGEKKKPKMSTGTPSESDKMTKDMNLKQLKAHNLVKDVFNTLCEGHKDVKHYRITYGDEFELLENPKTLMFGDYAKYNVFHLEHGIKNFGKEIYNMLFAMPINLLWRHHQRPQGENEAKICFHVNVLLSCMERADVETTELIRLIHLLACRKLYNNRSSLHQRKRQRNTAGTLSEFKNYYLKRTAFTTPLPSNTSLSGCSRSSTPFFNSCSSAYGIEEEENVSNKIRALFDCPDLSELASAAEIAQGKPIEHILDNYDYFEDFEGYVGFQVLQEAFNNYSCVDYKYCEVTDNLLVMFYNSHDHDGIGMREWRAHIPTPVCLEDFFHYVLDEVYEWVRAEEALYDIEMQSDHQSLGVNNIDSFLGKSCLSETNVAGELLMEGSLKHKEAEALLEPIDSERNVSLTRLPKSVSKTSDIKGSKKPTAASTPKSKDKKGSRSESQVSELPKPFYGYDLGDRRVEAFGKDMKYFAYDGTSVYSKYCILTPHNIESIVVNVTTGNGLNNFWMYKIEMEFMTQELIDHCESFRITRENQLSITIRKNNVLIPSVDTTVNDIDSSFTRTRSSMSRDKEPVPETVFENKTFYSFVITWPTGLIIKSVYETNLPTIAHIKQFYLVDTFKLQEDCRCINHNGEIVIFKNSGDILVFRPDSTVIKITKAYKKEIIIEPLIPEKKKEEKGKKKDNKKDHKKDKKGKVSQQSLVVEEKPREFELIIENFEINYPNGVKQIFVGNELTNECRLLIRTATDYNLGEVLSRRMDGTNVLINKDGVQVVTFPDGSRIITQYVIEEQCVYPEWTAEEKLQFGVMDSEIDNVNVSVKSETLSRSSFVAEEQAPVTQKTPPGYVSIKLVYTVEHTNYATVTVDMVNETFSVDNPDGSSITVDQEKNYYNIKLDDQTKATFDGEFVHGVYDACTKCGYQTTFDIKVRQEEQQQKNSDPSVQLIAEDNYWLKMKDRVRNVVMTDEGYISVVVGNDSEHELTKDASKSESKANNVSESTTSDTDTHKDCGELYFMKKMRFFTISRNLNCSELLHRRVVEEYRKTCSNEPLCTSETYDTFGDHRQLISILSPVKRNIPQRWVMNSKLCALPERLSFKHLKPECGKGWYAWMRPYERFTPKPHVIPTALPPSVPNAFILRTLELQWNEEKRDALKGGQELVCAVLKYRQIMEEDCEMILHVPVLELRSVEDKRRDDIVQAMGQRLYDHMCSHLLEEVRARAKADITTKPLTATETEPSEILGEGEGTYDYGLDLKLSEKEFEELEAGDAMSSNLRRYWRHRAIDLEEEEFHKMILRDGQVPPYFLNILGGAIWEMLNHKTEKALKRADHEEVSISFLEIEAEQDPAQTESNTNHRPSTTNPNNRPSKS